MNLFVRALLPGMSRGWAILMSGVLLMMLAGTWWMARANEGRSVQLMVARLAHTLSTHTVEWMLGQHAGRWVPQTNPFQLLTVRPDNYCGEQRAGEPLQRGCWYYQPQTGQVIYRARFGEHPGGEGDVQVWNLVVLPPAGPAAPRAVELQAAVQPASQ